MHQIAIVTTTLPSSMSNNEMLMFKSKLVEAKLSACAQSNKINSTYSWGDKLVSEDEWRIIFKTATNRVDELISAITKAHPYDLPQIIHRTEIATKEYSTWVEEQVS
jgi:periplasmic divalent cation tolerance protein